MVQNILFTDILDKYYPIVSEQLEFYVLGKNVIFYVMLVIPERFVQTKFPPNKQNSTIKLLQTLLQH